MNRPEHYQPILYLDPADVIGPLPYWLGAAVKYIWRAPLKNGGDDYRKAVDCLIRWQRLHGFAPAPRLKLDYRTWVNIRNLSDLLEQFEAKNYHAFILRRILNVLFESCPERDLPPRRDIWGKPMAYTDTLTETVNGINVGRYVTQEYSIELYKQNIWQALNEANLAKYDFTQETLSVQE